VLLLLDLDRRAVLESPFDNISLFGRALDEFALLESRPELAEVLELDQVPDIAEGRLDDGRLADGGGSGDTGRHCVYDVELIFRCVFWVTREELGRRLILVKWLKFGGAHVRLSCVHVVTS